VGKVRAPDSLYEIGLVAKMAAAMCRESPRYAQRIISETHMEKILSKAAEAGGFVRVYDNGEEITGIMVGVVAPYLCGTEFYACDLILYVKPESRGTPAALSLVKEFEIWAKDMGAVEVMLGTSTGIDAEKTACLYERLGYSLVSKGFSKGV
jgi:GNAT superfamily N-acetyltransferase